MPKKSTAMTRETTMRVTAAARGKTTHQAPAVARAIRVLKLLAAEREPMGVNAIARELDVVPSSCLHILRALADDGLVQVDTRSKQYALGLGLLTLAHDMLGKSHFASLVQPELERLARRYGATATAVELDTRERMVVVAVAQAPTFLQIQVGVGSRFPAYISATGRCVAAHAGLDRAQLRQRFAALKWQAPPRFDDWLTEVDAARSKGFAVDVGNYICGFTIVAALVGATEAPRQAISIVCVSEQINQERRAALEEDTRETALRLGARLRSQS
ncbi:MAG: IclR family transcriptional regulator [Burkholderiales bacterium]